MKTEINDAKNFAKAHLQRMEEIRDLMKKFVQNKDEYMVENAVYVTEQLTHYESHNLTGYNSCGFTIKSTDGERGSLVQQMSDVNEIFKETSIIDEVRNKFGRRQTLAEMQQQIKNELESEQ